METNNTIQLRLKALMKCLGMNQGDFGKAIGVHASNVSEIMNGKRAFGDALANKVVLSFGNVSKTWLLTGEGEMLKSPADGTPSTSEPDVKGKLIPSPDGIPLIPLDAMAGYPGELMDGVRIEDCEHYSVPEFQTRGAEFIIRVSGDSMVPTYLNGDLVALKEIKEVTFFRWGEIYVLSTNQGILVKRVQPCDDDPDCVLCVSDNPSYRPFQIHKSDVYHWCIVVGVMRLA